MNKEIWRPVVGYEGLYEVSNLGRVKSLERIVERSDGVKQPISEIILKSFDNGIGYLMVNLYDNGKRKGRNIHQLVAESFLNHIPCGYKFVVNHINFNKQDNRVENLEIVTARENSNKKHLDSTSDYVGVSFHKASKKWRSRIFVDGRVKHLGYFTDEYKAHLTYQLALTQLTNPTNKQTSLNL